MAGPALLPAAAAGRNVRQEKAHKHKLFGPVALGRTPGFAQEQTGFVPGTNPLCPKGPKIERIQSRLKFSISLENFNPDL